jgi:hypothetical protein
MNHFPEVRKLATDAGNANRISLGQGLSYAHWGSPNAAPDNTYGCAGTPRSAHGERHFICVAALLLVADSAR